MSVIVVIALGIELGQVRLPGKLPDTTDWFLESLGGILGYVMLRIIRARLSKPSKHQTRSQRHARDGKLHSR